MNATIMEFVKNGGRDKEIFGVCQIEELQAWRIESAWWVRMYGGQKLYGEQKVNDR